MGPCWYPLPNPPPCLKFHPAPLIMLVLSSLLVCNVFGPLTTPPPSFPNTFTPSPNCLSPTTPQLPPPLELIDDRNIINWLFSYAPHHPAQLPPHLLLYSLPVLAKVNGHMTFEQPLFLQQQSKYQIALFL